MTGCISGRRELLDVSDVLPTCDGENIEVCQYLFSIEIDVEHAHTSDGPVSFSKVETDCGGRSSNESTKGISEVTVAASLINRYWGRIDNLAGVDDIGVTDGVAARKTLVSEKWGRSRAASVDLQRCAVCGYGESDEEEKC